jgi:hypothetical protein
MVGWLTCSAAAPAVNEPCSRTATRYASCRNSIPGLIVLAYRSCKILPLMPDRPDVMVNPFYR